MNKHQVNVSSLKVIEIKNLSYFLLKDYSYKDDEYFILNHNSAQDEMLSLEEMLQRMTLIITKLKYIKHEEYIKWPCSHAFVILSHTTLLWAERMVVYIRFFIKQNGSREICG